VAIVGVAVMRSDGGGGTPASEASGAQAGLPNTPDYHSLAVNPSDPNRILLGTHQGLFTSSDGGKTWAFEALSGQDAMNLARNGRENGLDSRTQRLREEHGRRENLDQPSAERAAIARSSRLRGRSARSKDAVRGRRWRGTLPL
jgi:hypothetical protein